MVDWAMYVYNRPFSYILFSQYKSPDNTQEDSFFVLLTKQNARKHVYACAHFNEQNKEPNLLGIITWSVSGKQNVQAN